MSDHARHRINYEVTSMVNLIDRDNSPADKIFQDWAFASALSTDHSNLRKI